MWFYVNNKVEIKFIYNVIGIIYGCEELDRYVLIGSYWDVWFLGVVDFLSGIVVLLEILCVVSKMFWEGWRFWWILKFCSWGVEEFGLIGLIEWVE